MNEFWNVNIWYNGSFSTRVGGLLLWFISFIWWHKNIRIESWVLKQNVVHLLLISRIIHKNMLANNVPVFTSSSSFNPVLHLIITVSHSYSHFFLWFFPSLLLLTPCCFPFLYLPWTPPFCLLALDQSFVDSSKYSSANALQGLAFSWSMLMPLFHYLPRCFCSILRCSCATAHPALPFLLFFVCFYLSLLTCHRDSTPHHMCSISCFHFLLPACTRWWSWWRVWVGGLLCHHRSFCSPISIQRSTGCVRLGRMFYGVEFLRERNDGWETLSEPQTKHFLTSPGGVDEHWP